MTFWKTLFIRSFLIFLVIAFLCTGSIQSSFANKQAKPLPVDQHNLVILQYHHVSNETPSSTSVTPETFARHMKFLADNFHIIDLSEALSKIKSKEKLPNKSVAITFDDGYTNILENAHPILLKYNFPYTIFINPSIIGVYSSQLTWSQIRHMQSIATFANHSYNHDHLLMKKKNESSNQWLERVMNDINQAERILKQKTGYSKKWLAYPFGEFNQALKEELLSQGYIGFGQQSGGVSKFSDFGALPRFPAAGTYANLDSLETKLNSFAMPVKSVKPTDNVFKTGDVLEQITLVIDAPDVNMQSLSCYFLGDLLDTERNKNKIVVKVNHEHRPGRARINCTAPSYAFKDRFYWYSYPMFTPTVEGVFLD